MDSNSLILTNWALRQYLVRTFVYSLLIDSGMRKFTLFFFLLLLHSQAVFGQSSDSIRIAKAFTNALTDPQKKADYLKEARLIKQVKKSDYINDVYAYWNARYLVFSGQYDLAEKTVQQRLKQKITPTEAAKFYNILGAISSMRQDYKTSISWYEKATDAFEKSGDKKGRGLVNNNIANIFFSLSDFESAYSYAKEAYRDLEGTNDSTNIPNVLGVLSISEAKIGRYNDATKHANQTLSLSKRYNNLVGESLAHLALGEIAMSKKRPKEAVMHYQKTDSIASSINNGNFVHLAHVGLLSNYAALKDYVNAKLVGEAALEELKFVPNTTTEYIIRKHLSDVYAGLNDFKLAYRFRRESDSIYKLTSSIKNKEFINELLIRHQTSRKESQLKIEQKENLVKEAQLTKQTWFLFALGLMLLLAVLIFFNYRIRQRNKLNTLRSNQDKELMRALIDGEEKERERIANELHDGLASDLTGIQLILGQSKETIPNGVLDALSRVHGQTRRISHNLSPLHLENLGLVRALRTFTTENTTERTKIHFFSSHESIQLQLMEHGIIVYRMAQELIQNALKHAEASSISVQLIQQENLLTIHVEDDGKGFDLTKMESTFGLMNIKKHVALLNGELSIDSQPGNGTVVFISVDIA